MASVMNAGTISRLASLKRRMLYAIQEPSRRKPRIGIRSAAALLTAIGILPAHLPAEQAGRILDCESTFPPQLTAAVLEKTFGAQHLGAGEIHTGEGQFHEVTVLFPKSAEDRVEIVWKDTVQKHSPAQVWICGERSRWKTRTGLTVGMDLRSVEALNRRPFLLTGFSYDYAGTETSWRNGKLAASKSSPCNVRAVFAEPRVETAFSRQVLGGGEFSSGHPAMQALNPRIERLWLAYP